jgi:NHLM bacteriocin system ABC transporter peptidase/ATP-binding protein
MLKQVKAQWLKVRAALKSIVPRYQNKVYVKTPTILQMEAVECGAAALAIILAYYGRFVPLEELRTACGVSRDGSKASNMLKAARRYGLEAQGAKIEPESLSELELPIIVFWEFNHFVVIEGLDSKRVYINDPATGPRSITHLEFSQSFTGIALLFEPSKNFEPGGKKSSLWDSLTQRLKGLKNDLIFVVIASLVTVIPGIAIPGLTKIFIDQVLIQHLSGWLVPLLWGLVITGIFRAIISYLEQTYLLRLQLKMILTSSSRFLWHVLRLPFAFFSQRFAGDIQSRVESNDRLSRWLSEDLSASMVGIVSMLFYGIFMFLFDWVLTLIAIVITAANAFLLIFISRRIENGSRRLQQEMGKLNGVEMSGLQAIETLKASSLEDDFFERWAGYHAKTINSQQRIHLYTRTLLVIPQFLTMMMTIVILGLGGLRIIEGYLSIGGLVAFQSLLVSFNDPLMTLLGAGNKLQQIKADLTRLDDVQKHPEDTRLRIVDAEEIQSDFSKGKERLLGKLELRDVSYGYSPLEPPLLENINLSLQPGKRIAIVGASGSGKSTLAKLICGLYTPWSGEILWDDTPMPLISAARLSKSLGFVDQDIFLFEGTIQQNLTLWNKAVPFSVVENAVQDSLLGPLILNRPKGLFSEVLPSGVNFSGGQRQQLEIARALAQQPAILVLDEATSALDASTEQQVMENLKKHNYSMLMIAHRLSTIRDSDEIIVLEKGKIIERGTHDQLYDLQKAYYRLVQTEGEIIHVQ